MRAINLAPNKANFFKRVPIGIFMALSSLSCVVAADTVINLPACDNCSAPAASATPVVQASQPQVAAYTDLQRYPMVSGLGYALDYYGGLAWIDATHFVVVHVESCYEHCIAGDSEYGKKAAIATIYNVNYGIIKRFKVSSPQDFPFTTTSAFPLYHVATAPNGNIAFVAIVDDTGSNNDTRVKIFNSSGVKLADSAYNTTAGSSFMDRSLIGLQNNNFAYTYRSNGAADEGIQSIDWIDGTTGAKTATASFNGYDSDQSAIAATSFGLISVTFDKTFGVNYRAYDASGVLTKTVAKFTTAFAASKYNNFYNTPHLLLNVSAGDKAYLALAAGSNSTPESETVMVQFDAKADSAIVTKTSGPFSEKVVEGSNINKNLTIANGKVRMLGGIKSSPIYGDGNVIGSFFGDANTPFMMPSLYQPIGEYDIATGEAKTLVNYVYNTAERIKLTYAALEFSARGQGAGVQNRDRFASFSPDGQYVLMTTLFEGYNEQLTLLRISDTGEVSGASHAVIANNEKQILGKRFLLSPSMVATLPDGHMQSVSITITDGAKTGDKLSCDGCKEFTTLTTNYLSATKTLLLSDSSYATNKSAVLAEALNRVRFQTTATAGAGNRTLEIVATSGDGAESPVTKVVLPVTTQ